MKIVIFVLVMFSVVLVGCAINASVKENKRQIGLINSGECVITNETREVDNGYMQCLVYNKDMICMSSMWISNMETEHKFQCPKEYFWRNVN